MSFLTTATKKLTNNIKKRARRFISKMMAPFRSLYRYVRRHRLTNRNFTIISNDCCGGIMYHDLLQRFDSPTINLWIPNQYFFEFVNHLEFYVHSTPEEIPRNGLRYPVGRIKRDDCEVIIHFMHYNTFSEACEKWQERGKRVHMDNLYIVFNSTETDLIPQFSALPFPNKVMLSCCDNTEYPQENIIHMPVYDRMNYPGVIIKYQPRFSVRRWLDDFDYVSFLNRK